jgi:DNA-damage-inducible protein D
MSNIEQYNNEVFKKVIDKAKEACNNSDINILDHFADAVKMVQLGSGSEREIEDIMLSRYACYLIVQNADSRKKVVALGQTYFAVQTRKQELSEKFEKLSEDRKRLAIRNELKEHNKGIAILLYLFSYRLVIRFLAFIWVVWKPAFFNPFFLLNDFMNAPK